MDAKQEFIKLKNEVYTLAETNGELIPYSFFSLFADELTSNYQLPDIEQVRFSLDRPSMLVTGYCGLPENSPDFLDGKGPITLIASEWVEELETLTKTNLDTLIRKVLRFVDYAINKPRFWNDLEETNPAFNLAYVIRDSIRKNRISEFRIVIFTPKTLSKSIKSLRAENINDIPLVIDVWDLKRWENWRNSQTEHEPIEVDLDKDFSPFAALRMPQLKGEQEVFLTAIPGKTLAQLYERWKTRLLEQNVRLFLQNRTSVNRGIRETLKSEPEKFLIYNNGITATAEEVEFNSELPGSNTGTIHKMTNFQIVNGGQTTASIFSAYDNGYDISNVSVQMKLTRVSSEQTTELVPLISRYANSQNKVSNADFFSNHKFHIWMENLSRRLLAPRTGDTLVQTKWFYERTRGQYESEKSFERTRVQKQNFESTYPKPQRFNKTDLAKYYVSWTDEGYKVNLGAEKNFLHFAQVITEKWDSSQDDFNEYFYKEIIAKKIIFDRTRSLIMKQDWYEKGGYLAQHIPLTIGLIRLAAAKRGLSVDFMRVWDKQEVGPALEAAIITCSEMAHTILMNPDKGYRNISEWAKREKCWEKLSENIPEMPKDFENCLIDPRTVKEKKSEAKKQGHVDNEYYLQKQVIDAGTEFWRQVQKTCNENALASQKELDILNHLIRKSYVSPEQAKVLKFLLNKLNKYGLNYTLPDNHD
ncbi:hypothetical protein BK816_00200 [Boudabousia tangfeifanii]|uniref:AIPR protein n=1 Tax=Boudabousia tangfeifanii TaxID=1912795 RepID=A0A1D9MI67_9ACTO|nr:AIPR family protein [Boudabousia tangfeifanii]AOZ71903.1 hypothetical protein BK816_00200 [Boudabousia tangfeifanii]